MSKTPWMAVLLITPLVPAGGCGLQHGSVPGLWNAVLGPGCTHSALQSSALDAWPASDVGTASSHLSGQPEADALWPEPRAHAPV